MFAHPCIHDTRLERSGVYGASHMIELEALLLPVSVCAPVEKDFDVQLLLVRRVVPAMACACSE